MKELKSLAYNGLGYCYEAKGEDDMALESYEKAVKGAMEGAFSGMIYQNIARLYEKMKNNDKALEYYKKTAAQNTDPLTKVLVRRKIAELAPSK
jgi:tetratricopeptide (TPR) repeat protein